MTSKEKTKKISHPEELIYLYTEYLKSTTVDNFTLEQRIKDIQTILKTVHLSTICIAIVKKF